MSWIVKTAECDWCSIEINGLVDPVCESERGTLCSPCERARLEEKRIYSEENNDRRLKREIERVQKQLTKEDG